PLGQHRTSASPSTPTAAAKINPGFTPHPASSTNSSGARSAASSHDGGCCFKLQGMSRAPKLRIIVEGPPPGVDYALQKGSASTYETEQKQRSAGKDLFFEFTPAIRDGVSGGAAALSGPYVQGPPKQRFVYIDIGTCAGQADSCWSRRLKVPLDGITMK